MIKATIQNNPYCTEMTFPCTETELSEKLSEIGIDKEHLAPTGTVIDIEPAELSVLTDCEVSLDALNYLGKRMDGMDRLEQKQFLAVLSCDDLNINWGLKNIINLTYNLARFTLIEDTDAPEKIGLTHMLNIRGALSETEYNDYDWLADEGMKLLESGKGIDTEYGKLYVNEEIPFDEVFDGRTFPPYYCSPDAVAAVEISYDGNIESVELPCEDIAIKKILFRLGADNISDCGMEVDSYDLDGNRIDTAKSFEQSMDIFGLNIMLKSEDFSIKHKPPESIFYREMSKWLRKNNFDFSEKDGCMIVSVDNGAEAKIYDNGTVAALTENVGDEYHDILQAARNIYEYCSVYEKAASLKAECLSENYRCLAEFNGTVLAAKYSEQNEFEFVTWDRTYDGKGVCQGNYCSDYFAAKEDFAVRSGLVKKERLFSDDELLKLNCCVDFTLENGEYLDYDEEQALTRLKEKIEKIAPFPSDNQEQTMQNLSM